MHSFRNLIARQRSMDLVEDIYNITKNFPETEKFGIILQMRRCSVSVPLNIAEGWRRRSEKEKCHFYSISLGSISELETQIEISKRVGYITQEANEKLLIKIDELSAILYKLINKVNSNQ